MKFSSPGGKEEKKTYYIHDAQGNALAVYSKLKDGLLWEEQSLYGSSRLGIFRPNQVVQANQPPIYATNQLTTTGKTYELTNHLGNVLSVISDRKQRVDTDSDGLADYNEAVVVRATDYYPFGQEMPGRKYALSGGVGDYRYGFNGKEQDSKGEWGDLNHYDYGFRIYNPSVGRFLSVDPLRKEYPFYSPYHFAGNMPIAARDLDGREPNVVNGKLIGYTVKAGQGPTRSQPI